MLADAPPGVRMADDVASTVSILTAASVPTCTEPVRLTEVVPDTVSWRRTFSFGSTFPGSCVVALIGVIELVPPTTFVRLIVAWMTPLG